MLMLPYVALEHVKADGDTRWRLALATAKAAEATVRGQSAEMEMLATRRTTWDDWLRAVEGKTGAFLGLPIEGAALLAGLDQRTAARFGHEFAHLGVLFQLQDDLIDLTDAKGRGRRGSDLYEGKVSALVVEHLALHPAEAPWLLEVLDAPRDATREDDVERAMERFFEGGAVNAVKARVARYAEAVTQSPMLRAVPDLHAVAMELVALMGASVAGATHGRGTR
jgi:geranylgeranyl pyrophosphate synthase